MTGSTSENFLTSKKRNMKRHVTWGIMVLCFISLKATSQSIERDVIAFGGGSDRTSKMIIDWTLGQNGVETAYGSSTVYTQGFQQPVLKISPVLIPLTTEIDITISPNPVVSALTLKVRLPGNPSVNIQLTDINGKQLQQVIEKSDFHPVLFMMQAYAAGTYFLHVSDSKGNLMKAYQISKIN
jgi:hypothetical protein